MSIRFDFWCSYCECLHLGKYNLVFVVWARPTLILVRSNNNTDLLFFFLLILYFVFLGYNKIDKKQNFSARDIFESRSKVVWPLSNVTSMINIILFLDVPNMKLTSIILQTDRPEIILSTARTTKINLPLR